MKIGNKNVFVQKIDIPEEKKIEKKKQHLIQIIDRSGSMYRDLDDVIEYTKKFVRHLSVGDKITIGWFSGEGQNDFMLKSFTITDNNSLNVIDSILDQNKTTIGCTCFSEILLKLADEIKTGTDNYSMWFMTDGHPVVSNYQREMKNIDEGLSELSRYLQYAAFVGCGNYYNKQLMTQMAANIGGSFTHISSIVDVDRDLFNFVETASKSNKRIPVKVPDDAEIIFSIGENSIIHYRKNEDSEIQYLPVEDGDNRIIYLTEKQKESETIDEDIYYALALAANQQARDGIAIDALLATGDKRIISSLYNAFTYDEYGKAENLIKEAIFDKTKRFVDGKDQKFLPDENAFCLVDLIDILSQNNNNVWYPLYPGWEYERISVKTEQKSDTPKFVYDMYQKASFSDIVWNKEKLNLSVKVTFTGHVDIGDEAKNFGLVNWYPCIIFRNFSFVKDGNINVRKIYVALSDETMNQISDKVNMEKVDDGTYLLYLDSIPVMNRKLSKQKISVKEFCQYTFDEMELENKLSMYNYLLKFFRKEQEESPEKFDDKQKEFLKKFYISNGVFSPLTVANEPVDFYTAKKFGIKISGFSSKPSMPEIIKKIESKKKPTPRETTAANVYTEATEMFDSFKNDDSDDLKIKYLEKEIETVKKSLRTLRSDLQRKKFALLLSKGWFEEFDERKESYEYDMDGKNFIIEIKEVTVGI